MAERLPRRRCPFGGNRRQPARGVVLWLALERFADGLMKALVAVGGTLRWPHCRQLGWSAIATVGLRRRIPDVVGEAKPPIKTSMSAGSGAVNDVLEE
jgi:hypothetical protein